MYPEGDEDCMYNAASDGAARESEGLKSQRTKKQGRWGRSMYCNSGSQEHAWDIVAQRLSGRRTWVWKQGPMERAHAGQAGAE